MAGPASIFMCGLIKDPVTSNGAITRTSRGFLVWPCTFRFSVSEPRLMVPEPSVSTTSVSRTKRRTVITPCATLKSTTAQRTGVCLGSLASSSNRPGTTFTPISSASERRISPPGMATMTRPLELAAALCTLSPAPDSAARASKAPSTGEAPWNLGRMSSTRMLLTEKSTLLRGTAPRASSRTRPVTTPCGMVSSTGSSRIRPWSRLACSTTARSGRPLAAITESAR